MKIVEKIKNHKKIVFILGWILLSFVVAFGAELFFNRKVLRLPAEEQGVFDVSMEDIEFDGFENVDGKWILGDDGGSIVYNFDRQYVNKLQYSYDYLNRIETVVGIHYGTFHNDDKYLGITDRNNIVLQGSVVNIGYDVDQITISFPDTCSGLVFTGMKIRNEAYINGMRLIFVLGEMLAIGCLILMRRFIYRKPEWIFLSIGLISGIVMLVCIPSQNVSWDEEIHFRNSEAMSWSSTYGKSNLIEEYENISLSNYPFDFPLSYEEQKMQDDYIDENGIYDKSQLSEDRIFDSQLAGQYTVGYLGESIGLAIGRALHLKFSDLFVLGRAFNLITYLLLMFLAIRHLKVGKHLMTVIALMPTPMFLAVVYSYDATVTGLCALGFSYIISEYVSPNEKMTYKNYFGSLVPFLLASLIKIVYAPLLFAGLFLPKTKFESDKKRRWMKFGSVIAFVAFAILFFLPTLISPAQGGDTRGGATSVSGQISFILGNPMTYVLLLAKSIKDTFFGYMMGSASLGTMAYLGTFEASTLIAIMLVTVTITDTNYAVCDLKMYQRILLFIAIGVIICLTWTALYLQFTPVGQLSINGVQGRYYIPLMFPFFMLFNTKKNTCKIKESWYTLLVYGTSIFLVFRVIYSLIIQNCCR